MPTTATRSPAAALDATTLLEHIEQVAHWVSTQDPGRQALLTGVSEMKHRLDGRTAVAGRSPEFPGERVEIERTPVQDAAGSPGGPTG